MVDRTRLEAMLAAGQDSAMLRFALGSGFLREKEYAQAAGHFRRATELDPDYSAAWKNWGRCLLAAGQDREARAVLEKALAVARLKGDKQVEREAGVFLRRLAK